MATRDESSTTELATRDTSRRVRAVAPVAPAATSGEPGSVVDLLKESIRETADVLHAQMQLAVLEVREDTKVVVQVGVVLVAGGAFALVALALGGAAAAFALAQMLPAWAACLVVGVAFGSVAAVVLGSGRRRLRAHRFAEQTAIAAQEGERWIREKTS